MKRDEILKSRVAGDRSTASLETNLQADDTSGGTAGHYSLRPPRAGIVGGQDVRKFTTHRSRARERARKQPEKFSAVQDWAR